jgi:class 3 adenylate cyclase
METPRIRYAPARDGDSIAYQVIGDGPFDLVWIPGFVSHLDAFWSVPEIAAFWLRLASFSRLILFDKRGTGLSDPLPRPQPMEERFHDVGAVMDAAGSESAALVGLSEGCAMATLFAATYPRRTRALVLCGPIVGGSAPDHPAGERWQTAAERFRRSLEHWGDGRTMRLIWPTSPHADQLAGAVERLAGSPRMAREVVEMWLEIDLRGVLSSVSVPTLVLHRTDEIFPIEAARDFAARIPGAKLVELPGIDHVAWGGNADQYAGEIEEFLTGVRERSRVNRMLATLLMTDIVGSTARAAEMGDQAWRHLMARHDDVVRAQIRRYDGQEVKHTGDGFLASFDGPARAIRAARAIVSATRDEVGCEVRAGIHTGEVEIVGSDVRGLAVHVAARVGALAGPGEVLTSSTVKELVLGSGIGFEDRGVHELKGIPDEWRVYAVSSDALSPAAV